MATTQLLTKQQVRDLVLRVAMEAAAKGDGYAQEGVVMREIADELNIRWDANIETQRLVLDAWHDLFSSKKLGWGFNLDNPNSPFYHVRQAD